MHLRDISSWNVARASQSQVKAGVSAVIDNCMRNQAQPLGGVARNISEHCITGMHRLTDIGEMMMDFSKSGSLPAKSHPQLHAMGECDRTQKHLANGYWIKCRRIRLNKEVSDRGATLRPRCVYPGDLSRVSVR